MGHSKTNQTIFTSAKIVPMSGNSNDFEIIEDAQFDSDIKKLGEATNINIPSIGLSSKIKELSILDLENSRTYETPKNTVGHIPETGNPGELASGWFFGHLESPIRGEGNVFKNLPKLARFLREGNQVFIILDSIDGSFLYQAHTTNVVHKSELVVEVNKDSSISLFQKKFTKCKPIIYSFSHFDLAIDIYFTKERKRKIKNHDWILLNNIAEIGMPTIMKKIVEVVKLN